jgi:6-pyruvoyltetrahydropterin/6-carboxytetrahydropterin synthase
MPSEERFRIRLAGEGLGFSAAHFISYRDEGCEALHGHDYKVSVEISGLKDADGIVMDFVAVEGILRRILGLLDHKTILPAGSRRFRIEECRAGLRVILGPKEWVFPREDCALLPIANSTAEELAGWLAGRLLEEIPGAGLPPPEILSVAVEESSGRSAICTVLPPHNPPEGT